MSAHPDLATLWLDFLEETIPEREAEALRGHLAACGECRERFERLSAAHEVSIRAGRLAPDFETMPGPSPDVEAAVLRAAREAARGRRPARRAAWAAGLAWAAAAALVLLRPWSGVDAEWLQGTLATLAPGPGIRGGDPLSDRAEEAARRWRSGALRAHAVSRSCTGGGEVEVVALVEPSGSVAVLATRREEQVDVHVYAADGAPLGAARLVSGVPTDFQLPLLTQGVARERVGRAECP